ncbi:MAG: serine/threonine protein kinase [Nannocystis sp.]|nr:serine/threonine-protein kinase [Nannocystis sp.]MBA3544988.1 serine/threonine protein kinase [Nannocystis sp.]
MSRSGALRSPIELVTVGDFDPGVDQAIEYDFIGRKIAGRYTVRAHIGGGGMADVFQATDEELGIDVAIKLLKPRMASDELRARMVQEAQAAAQVRHANVVRVFSTGKLDSTAYIVMELLKGPNLERYVREYCDQRIPWHEALTLLLPALEGLHAIHERGYVHRDIKPGNILVTRDPGHPPTAIVIDLGLVKPDRALRTVDSPPTTEVGRMLCTPGYTSPEQALGRPVDRRSDVYSMAITLYRVLAGRLPFHEVHGKHIAAVLARHIFNEPTQLVAAAETANIPPGVAAVIESALRKDPAQRPQTMLEFAEALRAAAVDAAPSWTPRRHRLPALLLAAGLGIVVILLGIQVSSPTATPRQDDMTPPVTADLTRVTPASATASSGASLAVAALNGTLPMTRAEPPLAAEPELPLAAEPEPAAVAPLAHPPHPGEKPQSALRADTTLSRRRRNPEAAWHQALALRTADVQRCADKETGSLERLPVTVNIDSDARISAHVAGAADMPLSRCLDKTLKHTPLAAPREPAFFVHVFKLRTTPPRP